MTEYWNYIITAVGLTGFALANKKVWWCWYINIFNQILWFVYGWTTHQWGFVVGTFAYTAVFSWNAYTWTKEHRKKKEWDLWRAKLHAQMISDKWVTPNEARDLFLTDSYSDIMLMSDLVRDDSDLKEFAKGRIEMPVSVFEKLVKKDNAGEAEV